MNFGMDFLYTRKVASKFGAFECSYTSVVVFVIDGVTGWIGTVYKESRGKCRTEKVEKVCNARVQSRVLL